VGAQFVRDTEDMLLKINLIMNGQVLDYKDGYTLRKLMQEV